MRSIERLEIGKVRETGSAYFQTFFLKRPDRSKTHQEKIFENGALMYQCPRQNPVFVVDSAYVFDA